MALPRGAIGLSMVCDIPDHTHYFLSMISLFHKTFLRPLHDMSGTLEMVITGYPKVL